MGAYDCDCINNLEYEWRERKAQLSKKDTTKDTTSDLISRQEAIDELPYLLDYDGLKGENGFVSKRLVRKMLKELPPAQPEPKEGHWILHESPDGSEQYECSLCGVLWEFTDGTPEDNEAYYCPKCGARMKGEI